MKWLLVISFILLLCFNLALLYNNKELRKELEVAYASSLNIEGKIFNEYRYSFGKVSSNKKAVHVFILKNNSPASVSIDTVESNCGCTVVSWNINAVKPFQKARVVVSYDTRIRGVFKQYVNVRLKNKAGIIRLFVDGRYCKYLFDMEKL